MQQILEVVQMKSSPEAVWTALTTPELTQRYWGGMRIESDWMPGSKIRYRRDGRITDEHVILEVNRLQRLVHTFHPLVPEYVNEDPSVVTFGIEARGSVVQLSVRHEGFGPESKLYCACRAGWPIILNELKSLLESGAPPGRTGSTP